MPHLLLVVRHFGPTGHTGGFRWWRLVRGLAADHGWTADVVTSTDATAAAPPHGVTVHPVGDDWWGSRLRQRLAPVADAPASSAQAAEDRPDPDARTRRLADPSVPWPGQQQPLGDQPLRQVLPRDVQHATKLVTDLVWAARAARTARRLRAPDVVVATQPSETALLAGLAASRRHGAPLVTDHRHVLAVGRDTFRSHPERWLASLLDHHVTTRGVLAVDIACTATEHVAPLLPSVPRAFVPSGWDPADEVDAAVDRDAFRVVHAGWLYPFFDPRGLLRGLATLLERRPTARDTLRVELVGGPASLAGVDLRALAVAHGLPATAWQRTDRLPKDEAMRRAGRAAVLVAQEFPDGLQAPSKLYDYAVLDGDLLLLGGPDGAMARDAAVLGVTTATTDEQVAEVLLAAFDRWQAGRDFTRNDPTGRLAAARSVDDLDELLRAVLDGEPGRVRRAAATAGATRPPVAAALAAARGGAAS